MADACRKGDDPRILWLDDHPLLRQGAVALVRKHWPGMKACECERLEQAREALSKDKDWDVAIVDLSLADGDGRELAADAGTVPLLAYSMFQDQTLYRELKRLGFRGAVGKGDPPARLIEALRQILSGREAFPKLPGPVLTERELEVLRRSARGESPSLIGRILGIAPGSVSSHLRRSAKKLGVKTTAEQTGLAAQKGYLRKDAENRE